MEIRFDRADGICVKRKYNISVQMGDPGRIYNVPGVKGAVYNTLEKARYRVRENEYVLTGTVGEMWVTDAKHLKAAYCTDNVTIGPEPVEISTRPNGLVYEFRRVPLSCSGTIPLGEGRVLTVNAAGIDHGKGDVLIRPAGETSFWSVNGILFEHTYEVTEMFC